MSDLIGTIFNILYTNINISACGIPLSFQLIDVFNFELITTVIAFFIGKVIFFNQNTMWFSDR